MQISTDIYNLVREVMDELYSQAPAFFDIEKNSHLNECKQALKNFENYKHMLVLGIGGSALGTQSALQALNKTESVTILDHIDPEALEKEIEKIDWKNTCVNIISKSGSTLETMLQMAIIENILEKKFPDTSQEKIICTTGTGSKLFQHAQEKGYLTLPIPQDIGGRFSVLTPVGIFPLLFAGADIEQLIQGAKNVKEEKEEIVSIITQQYHSYKKEQRNILVLMSYQKKLMGLLDWYRQLVAESLGKNEQVGITPVLAFGSTDQHSQIQLYNEGPQDKLIYFLSAPFLKDQKQYRVLGMKNTLGISQTQCALFEGTKKSLKLHKRPFFEYNMKNTDEYEIGKFFMQHMISIVALAKLFKVNAFDQPGVEEGKVQAKNILHS